MKFVDFRSQRTASPSSQETRGEGKGVNTGKIVTIIMRFTLLIKIQLITKKETK